MFLFRAEVRTATDPRMGLGLFALEYIPAGSKVWEFVEGADVKILKSRVDNLTDAQREYFYKYGWIEGEYYVSSCDVTNFINHSITPNLRVSDEILISIKDINPGDEIFEDYREFDSEFEEYGKDFI